MGLTFIAGLLLKMSSYYDILINLSLLITILTIAATAIVKLLGWKWGNVALDGWRSNLIKTLRLFPIFGKNPFTKPIIDALEEVDLKSDEQDKEDQKPVS